MTKQAPTPDLVLSEVRILLPKANDDREPSKGSAASCASLPPTERQTMQTMIRTALGTV